MAISFVYFDVLEIQVRTIILYLLKNIVKLLCVTYTLQGNLTIATYIHFFTPGKLRIQSEVHFVRVNMLAELINQAFYKEDIFEATRRWLQQGESPYPGYCRAPASNNCVPLLCNCKKLREIWNKVKHTRETLNNKQLLNT